MSSRITQTLKAHLLKIVQTHKSLLIPMKLSKTASIHLPSSKYENYVAQDLVMHFNAGLTRALILLHVWLEVSRARQIQP
jgi:hypothetical protein